MFGRFYVVIQLPGQPAVVADAPEKLSDSLKKEWAEMTMPQAAIPEKTIAVQAEEKNENEDEENTAYPFGGWVDEENYNK